MKCSSVQLEPKTCKICGFRTDNMLIMVCPRCATSLPGPASCAGGCSSCGTVK